MEPTGHCTKCKTGTHPIINGPFYNKGCIVEDCKAYEYATILGKCNHDVCEKENGYLKQDGTCGECGHGKNPLTEGEMAGKTCVEKCDEW